MKNMSARIQFTDDIQPDQSPLGSTAPDEKRHDINYEEWARKLTEEDLSTKKKQVCSGMTGFPEVTRRGA